MEKSLPELGLKKEDCMELSWVELIVYFDGGFMARDLLKLETLLDRNYSKSFWKMRADFVMKPILVKGLEGMYDFFQEQGGKNLQVVAFPYSGKMAKIPESAISFPHRAGNIYH
ncbi:hypothetical protein WN944_027597 [Citrus x changshan-huyou]|uniref:Uncharacterized protein n=1 Tax=Citrus x changshan-huyou TaxID=2935761 RepID=A0AAP0LIT0_9ROSI